VSGSCTTPVRWINSADDVINPPDAVWKNYLIEFPQETEKK